MLKKGVSYIVAFVLLSLTCGFLVGCGRIEEKTYEEIKNNIFNSVKKNIDFSNLNNKTHDILNNINSDGSFNDIDYTSTVQTNWKPFNHLSRIKDLTTSYVYSNSEFFNNDKVFNHIKNGLNFWCDINPKSTNWFYGQLSNPNAIGLTLILSQFGEKTLPSDLTEKLIIKMKKEGANPSKFTGANKCDIALGWLYRGVLTKNSYVLKKAVRQAYSILKITTKEGIQEDFSYQQHGAQLYNLGYGNSLLKSICEIALATANTKLTLKVNDLNALSGFVINGYITGMRGKYGSYNLYGRGLTRKNGINNNSAVSLLQNMSVIDNANCGIYLDAVKRISGEDISYNVNEKNYYFFRSDYAMHNAKNYNFDVRTVSYRTLRNEQGNGENKKGYFLSDGAYGINLTGDEYLNIFPLWNWTMIPGVTAPQLKDIPLASLWQHKGTEKFVGGISDGKEGISTYSYYDTYKGINTGAKKSWFMLDGKIVCLGSSINSDNPVDIFTTINQTFKRGDILYTDSEGTVRTVTAENSVLSNISSVFHNNIVYTPLDNSFLHIQNQLRSGSWRDINENADDIIENDNILSLYINHGKKPKGEVYQYAITPEVSKDIYGSFKFDNIEILANNENIHAIKKEKENHLYIVFFEKGTVKDKDMIITADKPCVVMIKNNNVYISDPTQKLFDINLNIKHKNTVKTFNIHFNRNKEMLGKEIILSF